MTHMRLNFWNLFIYNCGLCIDNHDINQNGNTNSNTEINDKEFYLSNKKKTIMVAIWLPMITMKTLPYLFNPKFKNGEIVFAKDINTEFFYPAQIIAYVQGGTYLVNFLREYQKKLKKIIAYQVIWLKVYISCNFISTTFIYILLIKYFKRKIVTFFKYFCNHSYIRKDKQLLGSFKYRFKLRYI